MEKFTHALYDFYQRLRDDETRDIFQQKLLLFLDGDKEHDWEFFEKNPNYNLILETIEELRGLSEKGRQIILYGAANRGRFIRSLFKRHSINPIAFCDRDSSIHNTIIEGLPVISPETLAADYKDAVVVITTGEMFSEEIRLFLGQLDFHSVYDTFVLRQKPYFNHKFIDPVKDDEIYIDCGAFDGETISEFVDYTNNTYKKIYAFEPDDLCHKRSSAFLSKKNISRIELIKKGVWSETTSLCFMSNGRDNSCICVNGNDVIDVTSIDDVVGDELVTFIKMDIEGAELHALKGAAKTITRCKPRLAICVYHKPEDILDLPLYIHSLVPDYEYYLRPHESDGIRHVLYAL